MSRPCKLQINTSGAWRDVLRLDLDDVVDHGALQAAAADLVRIADPTGRTSLRITVADSLQTTLVRWDAKNGWRQAL